MSVIVLVTAFSRLKKVSQRIKMAVNSKVMGGLIVSYSLSLISQLFYLISTVIASQMDLSITTCLVSLTVCASQSILIYIFLVINSTEQKRKLKLKSRLSHVSTELEEDTEPSST